MITRGAGLCRPRRVLNPIWGHDEQAACPVGQTLGQTAKSRQTAPEIGVSPGFAAQPLGANGASGRRGGAYLSLKVEMKQIAIFAAFFLSPIKATLIVPP